MPVQPTGDANNVSENEEESSEEEDMSHDSYVQQVVQTRSQPFTLPETVTLIELPNGGKVYIVGSAHYSDESIKDVEYVMDHTCPDKVVLELCKSRSKMLLMDEEEIKKMSANANLTALIKRDGFSGGLTFYLMLRMANYLIKTIGRAQGMEFKAAFNKARHLMHCHIFLGDRPISITFKRAMGFLGIWAKIKLLYSLVRDLKPITKEMIEEMKKADLLEQLMEELAVEFPELARVFITERDEYLTRYIWDVAHAGPSGSGWHGNHHGIVKGVAGPPVTVAVVGIGHMAGIKKHWSRAQEIDKESLCSIPSIPFTQRAIKGTMKIGLAGAFLYGTYSLARGVYRLFR